MMPMTSAYLLIKYIGTIHVDDGLLSQTKVLLEKYTKTSKSADFGTKQNTADCEIRRFRGLLYVINGTKTILKVHIFSTKWRRFHEILNEQITNSHFNYEYDWILRHSE